MMRAGFGLALVVIFTSCGRLNPSTGGRRADVATLAAASSKPPQPDVGPELEGFVYPFPIRRFEFRSQNQALQMTYMDAAPEKPSGRAALLFHGKNFQSAYWEPTIRLLNARGYRVISPDQVGFGKSSKPATYQFSFHALAENTRRLLDATSLQKVSVVGHSMGGMLAVRFALMFPERVERLVLVNPIGLEDWKLTVSYRTIETWYAEQLKATPESIREYQRTNYYDGRWKPEYEKLVEAAAAWTRDPAYPRVAWCAALTYDMIFTQPVLYEFEKLNLPTLLIIGQRDRTALGRSWAKPEVREKLGDYPALGKRAAAAIPHAKLVELSNVGHLPQVEDFESYARALGEFFP
jgi:pimeloyl-ACP methyl ester carboxylesterase